MGRGDTRHSEINHGERNQLTGQKTIANLKSERARRPELAETLDLHIAILKARSSVRPSAIFQAGAEQARTRRERGEPLLRVNELDLDWDAFARLFQNICHIAARHRPDQAAALAEITQLVNPPARAQELARAYLASRIPHPASRADLRPPTSNLQSFVLNNALHPFLGAYAREYQAHMDDATWYRAYCPVCGGEPDFAALEKESGTRRLLCSRCDFEWSFHRSVCPFCGEDGKQGYFADHANAYRLYTCANCNRYLKTIDLREMAREVDLAAARVLTIHMDVAMYSAPVSS